MTMIAPVPCSSDALTAWGYFQTKLGRYRNQETFASLRTQPSVRKRVDRPPPLNWGYDRMLGDICRGSQV
jgi:hypothetical protein